MTYNDVDAPLDAEEEVDDDEDAEVVPPVDSAEELTSVFSDDEEDADELDIAWSDEE